MAKKKLKICISLVLNNEYGDFNGVTEFTPDSAADLLGSIRNCLNNVYKTTAFTNLGINSFKSVDVDVEETQ